MRCAFARFFSPLNLKRFNENGRRNAARIFAWRSHRLIVISRAECTAAVLFDVSPSCDLTSRRSSAADVSRRSASDVRRLPGLTYRFVIWRRKRKGSRWRGRLQRPLWSELPRRPCSVMSTLSRDACRIFFFRCIIDVL